MVRKVINIEEYIVGTDTEYNALYDKVHKMCERDKYDFIYWIPDIVVDIPFNEYDKTDLMELWQEYRNNNFCFRFETRDKADEFIDADSFAMYVIQNYL